MRIGFAGAGGVGCYFGGLMALSGLDVTLIGRGAHIAQIEDCGLHLELNGHPHLVQVRTLDTNNSQSFDMLGDLDWMFVTCKTYQTQSLLHLIAPYLNQTTRVISLQNGVDGPEEISRILQRPVYGGLSVRFVSHVIKPGEVVASGDGYIRTGVFPSGEDDAITEFERQLDSIGLDIRVSKDIRRELWRKLVINNGVNSICALLQQDCGQVFANAGTARIVEKLMWETIQAARADGVELTDADFDELHSIIFGLGPVKPSMQVDREHGRLLELDAISGAVLARSDQLGVSAAVTETIFHLLNAAVMDY